MPRRGRSRQLAIAAAIGITGLGACGGDDGPSGNDKLAAVEHYAAGVYAAYDAALASATEMDATIDDFAADPTEQTMEAAKQAWLGARDDYGLTEAFRFYGGPIDDEQSGPEGLINAWPLDEAYIDSVEGDVTAGIVNDPATYPTIDAELITSLNEQGGEANISTGWHAIEFLLWGQDLSSDGAGARPVTDFTDAEHADRRLTYLTTASDLLLEHLGAVVDTWAPEADNYRAEFVARDADALGDIITGVGELTRGELAGERMSVAYEERSQEDEHSCFSDNTTADLVANEQGIAMVLTGAYPGGGDGPGLLELFESADGQAATELQESVDAAVAALKAIPAPFDQHLADGVLDDDPGRASVLAGIEALDAQADAIVAAANTIGVTVEV